MIWVGCKKFPVFFQFMTLKICFQNRDIGSMAEQDVKDTGGSKGRQM